MKRIFCLLNAVVFMLLLCSCGKNDVPEDNQSSSGYTEEQTDSAKGTLLKKEPLTIEKVKEIVSKHGGTITNVDEWGKKRLAYEVRKMKEAFYYFIQFEGEATVPAEIESRVRIMENVVRYLCVRQDEE